MGLFDKKFCDVCGEKIGLMGNRKLEDGNLCKDCAKKLSPWFSDRRRSTVAEIKEQLEYREQNKAAVAAFHATRTLGNRYRICLDEDNRKFLVARGKDLAEENPDVLDYDQVTGCQLDVEEHKREIKRKGPDGQEISFNPPRYERSYDFYVVIRVNSPWFDQIRFQLNDREVEEASRAGYDRYKDMGEEIRAALLEARQEVRAAHAPKQARTCPWCGATTMGDARGCCEYCGGALQG